MKVFKSIAFVLALAGTSVLAWVLITLTWGEPFTAVSSARAQAALRSELDEKTARSTAGAARVRPRSGAAFGRLVVPRLDLRTVVVEGTRSGDLARGPGHYRSTALPGSGGVVAIAGHRTTYGHPFRHIDDLRPRDRVVRAHAVRDVSLRRVRDAHRRRPELVDPPAALVREARAHGVPPALLGRAALRRLRAATELGVVPAIRDDGAKRAER